jgi:hypothetical protein
VGHVVQATRQLTARQSGEEAVCPTNRRGAYTRRGAFWVAQPGFVGTKVVEQIIDSNALPTFSGAGIEK